jgi:hypothetical protein
LKNAPNARNSSPWCALRPLCSLAPYL